MRSIVLTAMMVVTISSVGAHPVWAQPGVAAPLAPPSSVEGPPPPIAPLPKARPGAHRPAVASMLSLGATVGVIIAAQEEAFDDAPAAAIAAIIVAPAAGRWYVGQIGVPGMILRGFGVGVVAGSFGVRDGHGVNEGSLILGMTLVVGGTLYDVIGAGRTAHLQNKRRWAATPTVIASPRGELAPGFALTGSY
ncbi:MAG TPA: hypothetical protein VM261_18500 [Kofleriaceae bacterium]|nr:hypothetical protein [Kofleriaceae bacterium]